MRNFRCDLCNGYMERKWPDRIVFTLQGNLSGLDRGLIYNAVNMCPVYYVAAIPRLERI
jgi:hypothetical protein